MALRALHPTHPTTAPVAWDLVVGAVVVALPVAYWWLDAATVHALAVAVIASLYVGFAVADGRPKTIAIESGIAVVFVLIAATAITGSAWLLVAGYFAHRLIQ